MKKQLLLFLTIFLPVVLIGQNNETSIQKESRDTSYAQALLKEAKTLIDEQKMEEALAKLQKARPIFERTQGAVSASLADCFLQEGRIYYFQTNDEAAEKSWDQALAIRLKVFGEVHRKVASCYANKALIYERQGKHKKAISLCEKALAIDVQVLGEFHPKVGNLYANLGIMYTNQGEYEKGIDYYNKALNIKMSNRGETDQEVASMYNNFGANYYKQGKLNEATFYFKKALDMRLEKLEENHPYIASSYMNVGNVLIDKGSYRQAIRYQKKSLKIRLKLYGESHPSVAGCYNSLGTVYSILGKYDQALQYFEKALNISLKRLHPAHPSIAYYYVNIGTVYKDLGKYDKAIRTFNEALDIQKQTLGEDHTDVAVAYMNIGTVYGIQEKYEKAIEFFEQALSIQLKNWEEWTPQIARTYGNMGRAYFQQEKYPKAYNYFEKALMINLKTLGTVHPEVGNSYKMLGNFYAKQGQFERAMQYYQKTLTALNYSDLQRLEEVNSYPHLISVFQVMAEVLRKKYLVNKNIEELYESKYWLDRAVLTEDFQHLTAGDTEKNNLAKVNYSTYDEAINVNYLLFEATDSLHYIKEAFTFSELVKFQRLYEAMRQSEALSFAGIPDSLLDQEQNLRADISVYNKEQREHLIAGLNETDTIVLNIRKQLYELKKQYRQLLTTFEKDYPDYYQRKYEKRTIGIEKIQQNILEADQVLLEYFVGESAIYIFIIGKDDFRIHKIDKDFPIKEWIQKMRDGIYTCPLPEECPDSLYYSSIDQYSKSAHQLYQKLIEPVEGFLSPKLIIIPDGVLGYLPFDALLSTMPEPTKISSFKKYNYLWQRNQISYCYSATLLQEMKRRKHDRVSKNLLAIAPVFRKQSFDSQLELRANQDSLKNNILEAQTVGEILKPATLLLGTEATEKAFYNLAGEYRLLHLATHSKANDDIGDYSYLAFTEIPDSIENEFIYTGDLYNLSLNADLVVLSACETGIGELQLGEGIISLASGFSYAGAKSIVSTLWKVDDIRTMDLVSLFYQNLKKGMPKDEALYQSKVDYIDNTFPEFAHPFFWAGFISIGDMSPIDFIEGGNAQGRILLTCFLVIIIISFFVYLKK